MISKKVFSIQDVSVEVITRSGLELLSACIQESNRIENTPNIYNENHLHCNGNNVGIDTNEKEDINASNIVESKTIEKDSTEDEKKDKKQKFQNNRLEKQQSGKLRNIQFFNRLENGQDLIKSMAAGFLDQCQGQIRYVGLEQLVKIRLLQPEMKNIPESLEKHAHFIREIENWIYIKTVEKILESCIQCPKEETFDITTIRDNSNISNFSPVTSVTSHNKDPLQILFASFKMSTSVTSHICGEKRRLGQEIVLTLGIANTVKNSSSTCTVNKQREDNTIIEQSVESHSPVPSNAWWRFIFPISTELLPPSTQSLISPPVSHKTPDSPLLPPSHSQTNTIVLKTIPQSLNSFDSATNDKTCNTVYCDKKGSNELLTQDTKLQIDSNQSDITSFPLGYIPAPYPPKQPTHRRRPPISSRENNILCSEANSLSEKCSHSDSSYPHIVNELIPSSQQPIRRGRAAVEGSFSSNGVALKSNKKEWFRRPLFHTQQNSSNMNISRSNSTCLTENNRITHTDNTRSSIQSRATRSFEYTRSLSVDAMSRALLKAGTQLLDVFIKLPDLILTCNRPVNSTVYLYQNADWVKYQTMGHGSMIGTTGNSSRHTYYIFEVLPCGRLDQFFRPSDAATAVRNELQGVVLSRGSSLCRNSIQEDHTQQLGIQQSSRQSEPVRPSWVRIAQERSELRASTIVPNKNKEKEQQSIVTPRSSLRNESILLKQSPSNDTSGSSSICSHVEESLISQNQTDGCMTNQPQEVNRDVTPLISINENLTPEFNDNHLLLRIPLKGSLKDSSSVPKSSVSVVQPLSMKEFVPSLQTDKTNYKSYSLKPVTTLPIHKDNEIDNKGDVLSNSPMENNAVSNFLQKNIQHYELNVPIVDLVENKETSETISIPNLSLNYSINLNTSCVKNESLTTCSEKENTYDKRQISSSTSESEELLHASLLKQKSHSHSTDMIKDTTHSFSHRLFDKLSNHGIDTKKEGIIFDKKNAISFKTFSTPTANNPLVTSNSKIFHSCNIPKSQLTESIFHFKPDSNSNSNTTSSLTKNVFFEPSMTVIAQNDTQHKSLSRSRNSSGNIIRHLHKPHMSSTRPEIFSLNKEQLVQGCESKIKKCTSRPHSNSTGIINEKTSVLQSTNNTENLLKPATLAYPRLKLNSMTHRSVDAMKLSPKPRHRHLSQDLSGQDKSDNEFKKKSLVLPTLSRSGLEDHSLRYCLDNTANFFENSKEQKNSHLLTFQDSKTQVKRPVCVAQYAQVYQSRQQTSIRARVPGTARSSSGVEGDYRKTFKTNIDFCRDASNRRSIDFHLEQQRQNSLVNHRQHPCERAVYLPKEAHKGPSPASSRPLSTSRTKLKPTQQQVEKLGTSSTFTSETWINADSVSLKSPLPNVHLPSIRNVPTSRGRTVIPKEKSTASLIYVNDLNDKMTSSMGKKPSAPNRTNPTVQSFAQIAGGLSPVSNKTLKRVTGGDETQLNKKLLANSQCLGSFGDVTPTPQRYPTRWANGARNFMNSVFSTSKPTK